jgi:predicted glycoside hydrolase/deacetylase ChbG (UPF0249 family)
MRTLIINADDLGANPQRSHGIFHCVEFGVVTSVSLVCNGSDSEAAGRRARERDIPTGFHLNLTDEYPLAKPGDIESLIETHGSFLGYDRLIAALEKEEVDEEHLRREIRAQIEWFFDHRGVMTHASSHQHIHVHPVIARVLLPILEHYGTRFVRVPSEPLPPFGFEISTEQLQEARRISQQADAFRSLLNAHSIGSSDHFRGLAFLGNVSMRNMRHIMSRLPEGVTELMVHPGAQVTMGTPFDCDPQRQTELQMLTDPSTAALLSERKIVLGSYAEM